MNFFNTKILKIILPVERLTSVNGASNFLKRVNDIITNSFDQFTVSTAFTNVKTLRFTSLMSCLYFLYCNNNKKRNMTSYSDRINIDNFFPTTDHVGKRK